MKAHYGSQAMGSREINQIKAQSREDDLEVEQGYTVLKPTRSDALPQARPYKPTQTAPRTGEQGLKYLTYGREFSVKPPRRLSMSYALAEMDFHPVIS